MDIEITFINNSLDNNNNNVLIFQKNVAESFEETTIAWRVIKNCGREWNNVINYPMEFELQARDKYTNTSPKMGCTNGDKWNISLGLSGDSMQKDPTGASSRNAIDLANNLDYGALDAWIYKDGKVLAKKTKIAPGQKATFEFKPTIWVGLASQVEEGDVINSAILSTVNTELSLLGLTKAQLIMTGGGDLPFEFKLVPTI